jgi:hypothetical protein
MKRLMLLAPPLALVAACGESAVSLQPGMWETTVQFKTIDIPGAPAEAVAPMRAMLSQPQTRSECLTPEEAANPAGRMMAGEEGNNCQYSDSTFAGGTIRVRGTCQEQGQGRMQMSMEGTYTATTMNAEVSSEVQPPAGTEGPQSIRMAGTLTARRTGECPASST